MEIPDLEDGKTALHLAAEREGTYAETVNTIRRLLKDGFDIGAKNIYGQAYSRG